MERIGLLALLMGLAVSLLAAENQQITEGRVSTGAGVSIHYLQSDQRRLRVCWC
ncbi:MAG TPA: hypothetical protein VN682_12785 [Terriglobales bacterium]|jgi:hypothetical protein|nr:hypothetical protein [Terriglobales bacterium]